MNYPIVKIRTQNSNIPPVMRIDGKTVKVKA